VRTAELYDSAPAALNCQFFLVGKAVQPGLALELAWNRVLASVKERWVLAALDSDPETFVAFLSHSIERG
jgi:hypothetical protein